MSNLKLPERRMELDDFAKTSDISLQLNTKEKLDNKVTTISAESTDDEYPSAKCVYDMIGNVETLLSEINGN